VFDAQRNVSAEALNAVKLITLPIKASFSTFITFSLVGKQSFLLQHLSMQG
jgi:hypothetical protein